MDKITYKDIAAYRTFIFDCDGVLLDSNPIKSEAFFEIALPYGREKAERLVAYHQEYGGVSRFEKIRYFLEVILNKKPCEAEAKKLIQAYGDIVRQRLLLCDKTTGIIEFIHSLPGKSRKIVVSGGMQQELREVFAMRGLGSFFDAIYGSPDTKPDILSREQETGLLKKPAVFFGDSKLDYEVAKAFGLDFIFVSGHTEFLRWQNYFKDKIVTIVNDLGELCFND